MTIRCAKCNRKLKAPTETGLGPVCARAAFGTKPKRPAAAKPARVRRDDGTPDMFAELADYKAGPYLIAA